MLLFHFEFPMHSFNFPANVFIQILNISSYYKVYFKFAHILKALISFYFALSLLRKYQHKKNAFYTILGCYVTALCYTIYLYIYMNNKYKKKNCINLLGSINYHGNIKFVRSATDTMSTRHYSIVVHTI